MDSVRKYITNTIEDAKMKLMTNLNRHTIILSESQLKELTNEAIKVATAKEPDATTHSTQNEFDKIKKCPKCGTDMPFLMCVYDEYDKNDNQEIGKVENGKWHETEYQAFGIWQCPKCFHVEAESNMA